MTATADTGFTFVDADGHVLEPPTGLQDFAPSGFRDRIWHLERDDAGAGVDRGRRQPLPGQHVHARGRGRVHRGGQAGARSTARSRTPRRARRGWDPDLRVQAMDKDGIAVSVLYPTEMLAIQGWPDVDYTVATCRAYNDWLSDHCERGPAGAPVRRRGAAAAEHRGERRRAASASPSCPHIVGAFLRPNPTADWKHFHHEVYDPIWRAASDTNFAIGFHPYLDAVLPGAAQGLRVGMLGMRTDAARAAIAGDEVGGAIPGMPPHIDNMAFVQAIANPVDMMTSVTFITMGGVCERFPDARFVFLEANGGWIVPWLERLDHHAHEFPWDMPGLKRTPSEYFRRQCYISFDPDEAGLPLAATHELCGADRIVWASDFPHPDAKYPGVTEELMEATDSLDDDSPPPHRRPERPPPLRPHLSLTPGKWVQGAGVADGEAGARGMAAGHVVNGRRLGGMVARRGAAGAGAGADELVRADGRPQPAFREELRRIPSWRNAWAVAFVWIQTIGIVALAVWWGNPIGYVVAFLLMGRACAQLASLMHESAHRLLFANRKVNDVVGRWLCGYPIFTSTDAYRRVHMAHHRHEFGPDEPDIPLYADYPIGGASLRRKLVRDATGQHRLQALPRPGARVPLARAARAPHALEDRARAGGVARRCHRGRPLVALPAAVGAAVPDGVAGHQPPALDRRARRHGRVVRSARRPPTRCASTAVARTFLVPYYIGWHLAHHVDAGVPMRALPRYHRALLDAGYVPDGLEYPSYPSLWRALRAGDAPAQP